MRTQPNQVRRVPTDPQRGFELMFRLYGPKKEFFDKVWRLPDTEKISVQ